MLPSIFEVIKKPRLVRESAQSTDKPAAARYQLGFSSNFQVADDSRVNVDQGRLLAEVGANLVECL
jgi:hypothetical protein